MNPVLENCLTWISAVGSIASLIGIYITLRQVKTVREISQQTRNELNRTNVVSDISRCNSCINAAVSYIKDEKYNESLSQLKEAKVMIIKMKVIVPQFKIPELEHNFHTEIAGHILALSESINSIEDNVKTPHLIRTGVITRRMDDVSNYIIELQARITNRING